MKCVQFFLSIIYIWNLSQAQIVYIDSPEKSLSNKIGNQMNTLLIAIENLKLRLELMEQSADRANQRVLTEMERKFNSLEQTISEVKQENYNKNNELMELRCENTKQKIEKPNNNIYLNYQSQVPLLDEKSINVNEDKELLQSFELKSNLKNIENQLSIIKNITTKIHEKEQSQVCVHSEDQQKSVSSGQLYPTSCLDFNETYCSNTKCRIQNRFYGSTTLLVSCDTQTDGGGWTVIQRRINGSVDFYREWSEYKQGFGDIDGEFFIGLDKLHALTTSLEPVELLIQLRDFDDILKYAKYDAFAIANETEKYSLKILGNYTGNAGDSLSHHKGDKFSTKDQDNDADENHCAQVFTGAWWYYKCLKSNLNGVYNWKSIIWRGH